MTYRRTLAVGAEAAAVHIERTRVRCEVRLNGVPIGVTTPLRPTLWLGRIQPGDELALIPVRSWGEEAGRPSLLIGRPPHHWHLEARGLPELREAGESAVFSPGSLPVRVPADAGVWLRVGAGQLADAAVSMNTVVRFDGDGMQLTGFTARHGLGRVVLGGIPGTTFAGGRGDLFLVPESDGDLLIYAEATRTTPGVLRQVLLGGPVDR